MTRRSFPVGSSGSTGKLRVALELGATGSTLTIAVQNWRSTSADRSAVVGPFFLADGLERLVVRGADPEGQPVQVPLRTASGAEMVPLTFAEVEREEQLGIIVWALAETMVGTEGHIKVQLTRTGADPDADAATVLTLSDRGGLGKVGSWVAPLDTKDLTPAVYRLAIGGDGYGGSSFVRILPKDLDDPGIE